MENEKDLSKVTIKESSVAKVEEMAPVLSIKKWLIISLILMLPIVNLVMLIIWALDEEENPNKTNFAKAQLIWMVIGVVFSTLFLFLTFGLFRAMFN